VRRVWSWNPSATRFTVHSWPPHSSSGCISWHSRHLPRLSTGSV